MGNLIQYAKEFASQSFDTIPISDIDILLLTELLYLYFDQIIPTENQHAISLAKAGELFLANSEQYRQTNAYLTSAQRIDLLKVSYQSPRFADVELSHYVNDINAIEEKQFAALTYRLDTNTYLIVFRGTDDTLIGWKEDFNLSYSDEIPAQIEAMRYLDKLANEMEGNFYVSGHSKGGNLAIYAATKGSFDCERLLGIYSFDGPGFREAFLQKEAFNTIAHKIHYYIPQESFVGEFLMRHDTATIVKSKQFGLLQHDPKNWEITNGQFVTVDKTTALSTLVTETFRRWLNQRENSELKRLFDTIFDLFQQANITSLNDLTHNFWDCVNKLRIAIAELDPELREMIDGDLNTLLYTAWNISKEKNIEQYQAWQSNFEEWFASIKESTLVRLFSDKNTIKLSAPPRTQPPVNPITKEPLK